MTATKHKEFAPAVVSAKNHQTGLYTATSALPSFTTQKSSTENVPPRNRHNAVVSETRLRLFSRLSKECRSCARCRLSHFASIFGNGPLNARLVVVGDYGDKECASELTPFAGRVGGALYSVLNKYDILDATYFTNAVKCVQPGAMKSTVMAFAINQCRYFLHREVTWIGPTVVVTMGDLAYQAIHLKKGGSIGEVRYFRDEPYSGIKCIHITHPRHALGDLDKWYREWEEVIKLLEAQ